MKKYLLSAVALMVVQIWCSVSHAQTWQESYQVDQLKSYLPSSIDSMVLVSAGDNPANADEASGVLKAALEQTKMVRMVMPSDAIGDVKGLDDKKIVAKCAHLPVEVIGITRVFPGSGGTGDNAVTSFYSKDATVWTAISVQKGVALASNPNATSSAGQGVTANAASVVSGVTEREKVDVKTAIDKYEKNVIWFQDWIGISAQSGAVVAAGSIPKQGKYGKPLKGSEFYKVVDRPDMAKKYKIRMGIRLGALGIGIGLGIGGIVWMLKDMGSEEDHMTAQLVLMGTGLAFDMFAMFFGAHPVKLEEMKEMADKHNEQLKVNLGLTDEILNSYKKLSAFAGIGFSPFAMKEGAGLGFSGKFNLEIR